MPSSQLQTPLLFIIFNRPDTTRVVWESIRAARPTRLFVTADGPRPSRPTDAELCTETRAVIADIDWPCEVQTLFREENLGCKYAVADALDWFFREVEEGIILEDDDVPEPSFFPFCEEMLKRYRDDTRVMHISGNNFQQGNTAYQVPDSYYFSAIPHIWGWATWRRAWKHFDVEVRGWPHMRDTGQLRRVLKDPAVAYRWGNLFRQYYEGLVNSYDGQWSFACLEQEGLCITPSVNLVSNIGFGAAATHTFDADHWFAHIPTQPMAFPLRHPAHVERDEEADAYTERVVFEINSTWSARARWFLKSRFTIPYLFLKRAYYAHVLKQSVPTDEHLLMRA